MSLRPSVGYLLISGAASNIPCFQVFYSAVHSKPSCDWPLKQWQQWRRWQQWQQWRRWRRRCLFMFPYCPAEEPLLLLLRHPPGFTALIPHKVNIPENVFESQNHPQTNCNFSPIFNLFIWANTATLHQVEI